MKSDEWIIAQLSLQEEDGLVTLIDQYAPLLKSIIRKHLYALPNHQDECLNDVFLAIWNHIHQYDSNKSSFKNWICAIARYRSINTLKKYSKDITVDSWNEQMEQAYSQTDQPFSKELWEIQLAELLEPLNEKDRALFKDMLESNHTTEEIAQKYHLSQGALYNRISRGKAKLKAFFQKKGENHYE